MKRKFYVDLWPNLPNNSLFASTDPVIKCDGARRFVFEVELPDMYFPDETTTAGPAQEVKQ